MIMLSKREKETLREISEWKQFYANWKPKTRAKLEALEARLAELEAKAGN